MDLNFENFAFFPQAFSNDTLFSVKVCFFYDSISVHSLGKPFPPDDFTNYP